MINLVFADADGQQVGVEYEVHPRSQEAPVPIPAGAATVAVYLGTTGPPGE